MRALARHDNYSLAAGDPQSLAMLIRRVSLSSRQHRMVQEPTQITRQEFPESAPRQGVAQHDSSADTPPGDH